MLNPAEYDQLDPLSRTFLDACRRTFQGIGAEECFSNGQLVVTIAAKHPETGELAAWVDPGEVTVGIGEHFHCHFDSYLCDDPGSEAAQRDVVEEAITYMRDVLNDRIVLKVHTEEGRVRWSETYHREKYPKMRTQPGTRQFIWSGPLVS